MYFDRIHSIFQLLSNTPSSLSLQTYAIIIRAGTMAQQVKCLIHGHKDLGSDPQLSHAKLGMQS